MREWLLRWLGAPRPIVIELDVAAITAAQPGALVILRINQLLTGDRRKHVRDFIATLQERHSDVRFLLFEGDWDVCVAPAGTTATTSKSGRQ